MPPSAVVPPCPALDFLQAWSFKHQNFSEGPSGFWASLSSYDGSHDSMYFPHALPVLTVGVKPEDDVQLPMSDDR